MAVLRVIAFVVGAATVAATFGSAIRTVILPRGVPAMLARVVFRSMRGLFTLRIGRSASYERRDALMALYAPITLLVLLGVWMALVLSGYLLMFWGLGGRGLREAFELSGSSIFTLGFARSDDVPTAALTFSEALLGLGLLALLITYLPTIYGAFSRREAAVTALEVRAGSPPWAVQLIERYWGVGRIDRVNELWSRWEAWFVEVEESHTSFPSLVFFRSPQPDHSWVTAAGTILDAASMVNAAVAIEHDVEADFCIRAGYLALRRIAGFFDIPYDPDPRPDDPISLTRGEFEQACQRLAVAGVPLKPDRDQAWRDFAGWRVNYDAVLIALAGLTIAPYAPWVSDRSLRAWRPPIVRRGRRRG